MDDARYKTARWRKLRSSVLRQEPLCTYCRVRGRAEAATTVDHIQPVARGGRFWDQENLAPACASCNYSKADTPLDEWLAGGCGTDGFGGFWDEKNQTSLAAHDRVRPFLHTKLES